MPTAREAASRRYSSDAASVTAARHFLASQLQAWDVAAVRWSAELVLTELATNAVLHAHADGLP